MVEGPRSGDDADTVVLRGFPRVRGTPPPLSDSGIDCSFCR